MDSWYVDDSNDCKDRLMNAQFYHSPALSPHSSVLSSFDNTNFRTPTFSKPNLKEELSIKEFD